MKKQNEYKVSDDPAVAEVMEAFFEGFRPPPCRDMGEYVLRQNSYMRRAMDRHGEQIERLESENRSLRTSLALLKARVRKLESQK